MWSNVAEKSLDDAKALRNILPAPTWLSLVGLLPSIAQLRFTKQRYCKASHPSTGDHSRILVTIGLWNDPDLVTVALLGDPR